MLRSEKDNSKEDDNSGKKEVATSSHALNLTCFFPFQFFNLSALRADDVGIFSTLQYAVLYNMYVVTTFIKGTQMFFKTNTCVMFVLDSSGSATFHGFLHGTLL